VSASADHLFDPVGFLAPAVGHEASAHAVHLDRSPTLVFAPDGFHARVVSLHSLDKAHYAFTYADIVGTAMKRAYPGPCVWIELFAGPGVLHVKDLDDFRPGSPVQATSIRDPFDLYVFVDMDVRCVRALRERVGYFPGVTIIEGDANSAPVLDEIVEIVPRDALVMLYADPAALDLEFATIKFFADRYRHLDLLINFPVPGVVRALAAGAEDKAAKVLDHPSPAALIGPASGRPGTSLRSWFQGKLEALGYDQFESEVIRLSGKNVPLYDLMLASRNPRAKQFFNEVQKRGPDGQYRLFF
jgi:three-Cys-motif partner protein